MSTIYVLEAVNLICGSLTGREAQPGTSTHLQLQELKLPGLEEAYADHNAGGGMVGIEVGLGISRLEATFNLAGWQPAIAKLLGKRDLASNSFHAYGLIRDKRTGVATRATAVMQGTLGRVNPTAFRRGDLHAHEYSIRSIVHYELIFGDRNAAQNEIFYFDFFENQMRVGGVDMNAELNQYLATGMVTNPNTI
jgi:phage tail tube protein FII